MKFTFGAAQLRLDYTCRQIKGVKQFMLKKCCFIFKATAITCKLSRRADNSMRSTKIV